MTTITKCRSKNPSRCWKHGISIQPLTPSSLNNEIKEVNTNIKEHVKHMAMFSKKNIINPLASEDFQKFNKLKTELKLLETQKQFLAGKDISPAERKTIQTELRKKNDEARLRAIRGLVWGNITAYETLKQDSRDVASKRNRETPETIVIPDSSSDRNSPEYPAIKAYYEGRIKEYTDQGYVPVSSFGQTEEYVTFYKPDLNDPTNYGTWELYHREYGEGLGNINRQWEDNNFVIITAGNKKRFSISDWF